MMPDDAEILALRLMREWGLLAKGWTFGFDFTERRFGLCSYARKRISLSKLLTCLNNEAEVKETILHEIAHALCRPSDGHGSFWRNIARMVGAKPTACYGDEVKHYAKANQTQVIKHDNSQDTDSRDTI